MNKYRIVLWDLDDTLINTKDAMKLVCFDIAKDMNIEIDEDKYQNLLEFDTAFWQRFHNNEILIPEEYYDSLKQADYLRALRFQEFFSSIDFEAAIEFNKRYQNTLNHYKPLAGAREIVQYLSDLGIELYIATNGPEELAIQKLDIIGISQYIKEVYGYEKTGYAKPNTKFFDFIFSELGLPKREEVLLIGDSLKSDIFGGNNYGIDTCWYNPDNHELPDEFNPQITINHLLELKNRINSK